MDEKPENNTMPTQAGRDKNTETVSKPSHEEKLAQWARKVPLEGHIIILNPHPNLIEQIRKLNDKKAYPNDEES